MRYILIDPQRGHLVVVENKQAQIEMNNKNDNTVEP